jgi:hypothetical protein
VKLNVNPALIKGINNPVHTVEIPHLNATFVKLLVWHFVAKVYLGESRFS